MEYLKADVERMCRKHRLHQAELNKRAKQNIPDKEYWAKKRGQAHLNQNNEAIPSTGGKQEYNITVTESRGRWSYLPEHRQRPITLRQLSDNYSKEAIEEHILRRTSPYRLRNTP